MILPGPIFPRDPYSYEIDLRQADDIKVPLVVGQEVEGVLITETRLYTIAELRKMVSHGREQQPRV